MPRRRKIPKGWDSGDIRYYAENKKRPIAYSTKATRAYLKVVSHIYDTVNEIKAHIEYCPEAIKVLDEYIKRGYGEAVLRIK